MEPLLVALVALIIIVGLIIVGTRFSTYLFLLTVEANHLHARRRTAVEEGMLQESAYGIERPLYYETLDTGSSSARLARNVLVVVAVILLIAIAAIISITAGAFH
jgi:hypothetical protein